MRIRTSAENAFRTGDWDLVCYGHTHIPDLRKENGSIMLNPGALENGDFCILTANGDVQRMNVEDFV